MKLTRFKELHMKVIHGDQSYEDVELWKEEKLVKKSNTAVLNLVCQRCFPLLSLPVFAPRIAKTYTLGYPSLQKVVWNDLATK